MRHAAPGLTPKLQGICRLIEADPVAFIRSTAKELCQKLGASEPTLIKFCQRFGYSGLADFRIDLALSLAMHPGMAEGVGPNRNGRRALDFGASIGAGFAANDAATDAIARAAVTLLQGDGAILIGNGANAARLAAHLDKAPPMTVMTSALDVAMTLLAQKRHQVMLPGGLVRAENMAITGRLVDLALADMRFDSFVMGADCVDPEAGLSTCCEDRAHQHRAMIAASARIIVLADRTTFSKPLLHRICAIENIDTLITDLPADHELATCIRDRGVRVISAQEEAST